MASSSRHDREHPPAPSTPPLAVQLPFNAPAISDVDYFQRNVEFRLWLKEEKRKYFDELSGEKARSYFRKFVKTWNTAKLPRNYYQGLDPLILPATAQTGYKWSFASTKTRADNVALQAVREAVGAATHHTHVKAGTAANAPGGGGSRIQGPTLPTLSDITLAREASSEQNVEDSSYKRKRAKAEMKDRVEDMVGPREVGREGMLERKRMRREGDRAFREKGGGDEGLEVDEGTLLGSGGGDSFRDQISRRDARRNRKDEERKSIIRERANVYKEKERATMDMFQQLAKQRFG